jgi:hypothetical protein
MLVSSYFSTIPLIVLSLVVAHNYGSIPCRNSLTTLNTPKHIISRNTRMNMHSEGDLVQHTIYIIIQTMYYLQTCFVF